MYISNSTENPKKKYWKCVNSEVIFNVNYSSVNVSLFIWFCLLSNIFMHCQITSCSCGKMKLNATYQVNPKILVVAITQSVKDLGCIIKDLESRKRKEKLMKKFENERKKANMFKFLLVVSWSFLTTYQKWCWL